jgi:DNA-binding NarL/FixJ family response regulator
MGTHLDTIQNVSYGPVSRCLSGDATASSADADVAAIGAAAPVPDGRQNGGSLPLLEDRAAALVVGLIDSNRFSQECLMTAFENLQPRLRILPFKGLEDCIDNRHARFDLILYYSHAAAGAEPSAFQDVAAVCQAFPNIRLIVLSDADDALQPKTIGGMLKSGAHGFIPTQTTGIPITAAAIHFVSAGGTFAPVDLLLNGGAERAAALPDKSPHNCFTSRQMTVLFHLQRGNANKIIAHELGMSESTVKVHVRNIMRKMNATNRTQAVYKARQLWESGSAG